MTALAPPPAPSPVARPLPGDELRFPVVFANLLPDEVVAARRLKRLKRNLLIGLAALLGVLVLGYGLSWLQTESSRSALDAQQRRTTTLQQQMKTYSPLLAAQSRAGAINQTLSTLMQDNVSWRTLIVRLEAQGRGDATITGFTGAVTDPSAATPGTAQDGGLPLLNETGKTVVGTLTINGTAKDKRSLAAFVERLGAVRGLTAPLPATVTTDTGKLTFSINALVTSEALDSRFATTPTTAPSAAAPTGGN